MRTAKLRQLRLLIVTSSFHPAVGGAESYVFEIARALAKSGHRIAIVTDLPRGLAAGTSFKCDPPGVQMHRLSGHLGLLEDESKIRWEQMAFGLMPELQGIADGFMPNVVLSNSLDAALLAKVIALDRGIPWAATFHEQAPESEPLGLGRLRVVYGILDPDLVLAGSEFYAQRARHWGKPNRVALVYHGVDTDTFSPLVDGGELRRSHGISPEAQLVVCAGRLKRRKGMRELIAAFGVIANVRPNARLLIVGTVNSASREYANQLRREAEEWDHRGVVLFDETVTFDRMPVAFAAADVVAQPSLEEGLGLAVIEAMACGKPVVTTDIPGIREITTNPDVAVVVPPGAVGPLGDALALLLDDRDARQRLGRQARQHVERHFSCSRMTQQTEGALLRLIAPERDR